MATHTSEPRFNSRVRQIWRDHFDSGRRTLLANTVSGIRFGVLIARYDSRTLDASAEINSRIGRDLGQRNQRIKSGLTSLPALFGPDDYY
jgi:hypothetical protein